MADNDTQRLMIKVARLYHTHGVRQTEIAKRLQISQSRVSRLLAQAEEASIVRTVVAVPQHIHAELEEQIEARYGLSEVHVVDTVSHDESEVNKDLAHTMASLLYELAFEVKTIAFTSWSKTLRLMVDALLPLRTRGEYVVETLGDLGPPELQHDAARSTQQFATLTGAQPVFLRTPGVVPSREIKELLIARDPYVRMAMEMLDSIDIALVGIGTCERDPELRSGDNFFTDEQFEHVRERGAVGEVCLHFIDAEGNPIDSELEDLVVGVTLDQLRNARHRWAVAGGERKHQAVRAAVAGGWVDTLVTDAGTAAFLLGEPAGAPADAAQAAARTAP
ncbi:sugar-binding transcriptional regulator [Sinomonas atrocyanea]|uniref:sugar-binding transcriptional regulator n=1 Tax=Sinomonas atrocyanea TaxID=37927 RepID=UPI00278AA898|nr:sugar-binding domain-containing protein [Sinomonas atrocyanea]MDQ0261747.1 DNA-binding transcriptional regulator LsrR (DeoR family) [Sinomonas atrocyanea]MDR6623445.1 DNA-binding transcriptional regulator LsrR (DeoR family) [Sinomonas atrocyanea]